MERRRQALLGATVFILGIAAGVGLRQLDFLMLKMIRAAISQEDAGRLLFAAMHMTFINALRVMPLYLGAFLLMEAWVPESAPPPEQARGYLIPALLVPGSYLLIRYGFGVSYDFGVPALMALLGIVGVHRLARFRQGVFVKAAVFGMFIFGWQWLSLAPGLTSYGFGRGELALEVKAVAEFLDQTRLLGQWSWLSFVLFGSIAVTMAKFTVDYTKHVDLLQRHQEQERKLQEASLRHLGARSRSEMQALVHDLKTPLTTVQGLVGVLGMTETEPKALEYVARIEQSVERMDQMISEILHPEVRRTVQGCDVAKALQAHVSGWELADPEGPPVRFRIGSKLPTVEVNVMRIIRALANLIQNARDAAAQTERGRQRGVDVRVSGKEGALRFLILDRGVGIEPGGIDQVFIPGFSTKDSSGLGLSFAREVIEKQHPGELTVYSVTDKGTYILVQLEGVAT